MVLFLGTNSLDAKLYELAALPQTINRVIEDWNHLPHYIVNANSLNSFKYSLDDYWTEHFYELL